MYVCSCRFIPSISTVNRLGRRWKDLILKPNSNVIFDVTSCWKLSNQNNKQNLTRLIIDVGSDSEIVSLSGIIYSCADFVNPFRKFLVAKPPPPCMHLWTHEGGTIPRRIVSVAWTGISQCEKNLMFAWIGCEKCLGKCQKTKMSLSAPDVLLN